MRHAVLVLLLAGIGTCARAADLPIFDAHLHYSHDALEQLPAKDAIALLRKAGVRRGMVSSSNDEGTQRLYAEAPELIMPELRPYRMRSEFGTWVRDQAIVTLCRGAAEEVPVLRDRRVPSLRRRR